MKKFKDFKQLPNETIANMHARFLKVTGEIRGLGKEIPKKEICLKVLRRLPSAWNKKVTAMRDHRDLRTLSTNKLFSKLKAYEFEMLSPSKEDDKENGSTLVVEQPSMSHMS